jgi:hypothetical protein
MNSVSSDKSDSANIFNVGSLNNNKIKRLEREDTYQSRNLLEQKKIAVQTQ